MNKPSTAFIFAFLTLAPLGYPKAHSIEEPKPTPTEIPTGEISHEGNSRFRVLEFGLERDETPNPNHEHIYDEMRTPPTP